MRLVGLILLVALYLGTLGDHRLQDPDEGRYAEMSREMVETGDWVTPRQNYVTFFHKPPLLYWGGAASMTLLGENEFAARLTPALAGILTVLTTFLLGIRLFGERAAWLAAGMLATTPLFFGISQAVTMDLPLTACTTAAFAAIWVLHTSERKRMPSILAAVAAALAILAKGPVVFALVGLSSALFLLLRRDWKSLRALLGWRPILAFLLVAAPWFVLVSLRNPTFLEVFVVEHHLRRFAGSVGHPEGPWFYVPVLLLGCLPWTLLAAGLGLSRDGRRAFGSTRSPALLFVGLWAAVVLGFFSAAGSKLPTYILPALPALALALGASTDAAMRSTRPPERLVSGLLTTVAALGGFLVVASVIAYPLRAWIAETLGEDFVDVASIVTTVFRLGGLLLVFGTAATQWPSARALSLSGRLAMLVVLVGLGLLSASGGRAIQKTSYELAAGIQSESHPDDLVLVFNGNIHGLPFYLGERVLYGGHIGELEPGADRLGNPAPYFLRNLPDVIALWGSGKRVYIVTELRHLNLLGELDPSPRTVARDRKRLVLANFERDD